MKPKKPKLKRQGVVLGEGDVYCIKTGAIVLCRPEKRKRESPFPKWWCFTSKEVEEADIMNGIVPKLPNNPTQEEMLQLAMNDIRQGKKGRFQLRYDKETRSIKAIDIQAVNPKEEVGAEEIKQFLTTYPVQKGRATITLWQQLYGLIYDEKDTIEHKWFMDLAKSLLTKFSIRRRG